MYELDHTHDPQCNSWVESSQATNCDFPIQNLPFCTLATDASSAVGVGIGDQVVNLQLVAEAGCFEKLGENSLGGEALSALKSNNLNKLMGLTVEKRLAVRHAIFQLLHSDCSVLRDDEELKAAALKPIKNVEFRMPARIGDYTDFYASLFHATNVGSMFRPTNPLLPNYKWIPIGYHGRASSVVVSGTPVKRPSGQTTPEPGEQPPVRPCALLDYELEVGFWVAQGNALGSSIPMEKAEEHLFGVSLLNDWSARDMQKWEYQPLGPFLAKSFLTTVSPWVITMEALTPFRCGAFERASDDPQPLAHLDSPENREAGGIDLRLEVSLLTRQMNEMGLNEERLSQGTSRDLYWTAAQMVAHHSSNGCNLRPGDLMGSGTVSGPTRDARGCLLELTWDGDADNVVPGSQRTPLTLPTGEQRKFLADGDELAITGYCEAGGFRRIGLGSCVGTVVD
jgi:fumarylacetoacetase